MVQIDIEMPQSCLECSIRTVQVDSLGDFYYSCGFIDEPIKEGRHNQRHKDCPLKEIEQAEWEDYQDGMWIYAKCSKCGAIRDVRSKYCPECGLKMKED